MRSGLLPAFFKPKRVTPMTVCGLDFGTSNSTIGIIQNKHCHLVPLEGVKPTIRSAIFCDAELKEWVYGQKGIDSYLEGVPGRLMMALKTVLGSSLMEDKTIIFGEYLPYTKVLSQFLRYLKKRAEEVAGQELTQVVLGRPVHFHDQDEIKDRYAQDTLEQITRELGFKDIHFQYEPIAAALAYETTIQKEQLALIVDMGGGTSDFSLIRLRPGQNTAERFTDVLANCGIHIAGTDFDQRLSLSTVMPLLGMGSLMRGSSSDIEVPSMFYHDLTTWHTLSNLYGASSQAQVRSIQAMAYEKPLLARLLTVIKARAGHHILDAVEKTKQQLSEKEKSCLDLTFIEDELQLLIQRSRLNEVLAEKLARILETVQETIQQAGVKGSEINAIFYTGGSTKIPIIREKINAFVPQATVVEGDAFGSVGLGLTIDAQRKYS
jgi:hypothetical chaperone protein